MHVNRQAAPLHFSPKPIIFGGIEILAADIRVDRNTDTAELVYAARQLPHRRISIVEREMRKRLEAIGTPPMRLRINIVEEGAHLGEMTINLAIEERTRQNLKTH